MSLQIFWDEFFSDSGDSLWVDFWRLEYPGSHSHMSTEWRDDDDFAETTNPFDYTKCDGQAATELRRLEAKLPLKSMIYSGEAHVQKTLSLFKK